MRKTQKTRRTWRDGDPQIVRLIDRQIDKVHRSAVQENPDHPKNVARSFAILQILLKAV